MDKLLENFLGYGCHIFPPDRTDALFKLGFIVVAEAEQLIDGCLLGLFGWGGIFLGVQRYDHLDSSLEFLFGDVAPAGAVQMGANPA